MRALVTVFVALASACVTTNVSITEAGSTTFTTNPAGARVFINGNEVCSASPCNWTEGDGLAHRYHLQVRKEGFQEIDLYLDKELRLFNGLSNGFNSAVGYKMPRQVSLTLEPVAGGPPPAVPPVPPPPGQPAPPPPQQPGL